MKILIFYSQISVSSIATYCSTIVFCFSLLCLLFLWAKMVSFSFSTLSFCLPFSQPLTHSRLSHSFSAIVGQSMLRRTRELNIVGIFWIFFRHRFSRFSCLPHSFWSRFLGIFLWWDQRDMVVCGSVFMGFRRGLQWWDRHGYGDGFGRGFLCICYSWWWRVSVVVGMGNWWWWWLMWVRGVVVVVGRGQWAWWWLMWVCLVIF